MLRLNNTPLPNSLPNLHFLFFLFFLFFFGLTYSPTSLKAESSLDGIWNQNNLISKSTSTSSFNAIKLLADTELLSQTLSQAPNIQNKALGHKGVILYLPLDDGNFTSFEVFQSMNLENNITTNKKASRTKTYKAFGIERPELTGHLDIGIRGFHAMILGSDKPIYIDPNFENYKKEKELNSTISTIPNQYHAFKLSQPSDFKCGFKNHQESSNEDLSQTFNKILSRQSGSQLLSYRIAVTASTEYIEAVSSEVNEEDKIEETLAAIETAINRVNVIYNQDFSIQLDLVRDERLIIPIPESNPFNNDADSDIDIVTEKINTFIGSENYDIGHLFTSSSTSNSGLAFFQSVCNDNNKGKGVTGVHKSKLQSDAFYVDYVAHEIGHQFGANHTFNGTSGSCSGNRNSSTAFEPGSGSTIMAYAGICGLQSLQSNSDPYFHTGSIDEILSFVNNPSKGGECKTTSAISNNPPNVNTGGDHIIPASTPFKLSASGNDIEGDPITYSWEQMDIGAASSNQNQMQQDNGTRTLFRSFPGTTNPTRYFPSFDKVLTNTPSLGETYPSSNRQLTFRVTARSGLYGSATNDDNPIILQSVDTGSAFSVIEPQAGSYHFESGSMTVLWDTANTENSPISCPKVDILLASDGGPNYESFTPILNNTLNNGLASVTLPAGLTSTARLLIQCPNNIFYNINNGNFNIINSDVNLFSINIDIQKQKEGNTQSKTFLFTVTRTGSLDQGASVDFTLQGHGNNPTNEKDFISGQTFAGTLSFLNNEFEKTITVQTKGDTLLEDNEQFSVIISNPSNAFISTATAIGTINNDDLEPTQAKSKSGGGSLLFLEAIVLLLFMTSRKISKPISLSLLMLGISACSQITQSSIQNTPEETQGTNQSNGYKNYHPQVQALLWVNNANPTMDAQLSINKKEFLFLATDKRGDISIPGLEIEQQNSALKQAYKVQKGMGDMIVNEEHHELRKKFLDYAAKYNQILAKHLFTQEN